MPHRSAYGRERQARRARLPLAMRFINRVGPVFASLGLGRISLSPDGIQRAARSEAGLSDFGDIHFEVALERLVASAQEESRLTHIGRSAVFNLLKSRLINRLLIQQALRDFPEVGHREIHRPMFVTGFSRSGTTLLFQLLALDPSTRSPGLWELLAPAPPPASLSSLAAADRMRNAEDTAGRIWKLVPSLAQMHAVPSSTTKEECFPLLENTCCSPSFTLIARIPSYIDWLFTRPVSDILQVYRYYAQQMKLLMHGHDGKRWLSKSPFHSYLLPALVSVFPDAQTVCTHREPAECVPSWCSFTEAWHSVFSDDVDPREIGEFTTYLYQTAERRVTEAKGILRSDRNILDIDYRELVQDPIGTVARVHDHFGLPLTAEHESVMHTWLSEGNPYDPKRAGRHVYTTEEFGLDRKKLNRLTP